MNGEPDGRLRTENQRNLFTAAFTGFGNDFHQAKVPYVLDPDVKPDNVTALDNFMPAK